MYKLAVDHFKPTPLLPYAKKGCGKQISEIVKNGKSDYTIVISPCANECEKFAAEELQNYIQKATGARLAVETENESVKLGGKYISVGETELARSLDTQNLNLDGFRLKTQGETLLIKGERDRGTLYGAYDFLEKFLCVRFVTPEYEYVPKTEKLPLCELDIIEIPAFELRSHHVKTMHDPAWAAKMRMVSPQAIDADGDEKYGGTFLRDWSDDMHTYKILVPYEKYGEQHPEWFSEPKTLPSGKVHWQPAWSSGLNDDGTIDEQDGTLIKELIEQIKLILLKKPNIRYLAMGQNDNHNISDCEKCVRQRKIFGGHGGHQIVFVNAVAKEIKKWMAERGDTRELYFVVYAYLETYYAPTKVVDGEIVPFHKASIPRDDVIVMVAPYEASYNESLRMNDINDFNFIYASAVLGWSKLCKRIFMFDYDVNFSDIPMWYPNTETIAENLHLYKELGANGVMTNGATGKSHYQTLLHTYLFSKLYWNINEDIDALISEFNALMFGDKAGYMIDRLVGYIRAHFENVSVQDGYKKPAQIFSNASPWMVSADTWNVSFITECERLVEGAQWYVSRLSDYDEETKALYLKNLAYIDLMVCYAKWKNYDFLFKKADKPKFMEKFKKCYELTGEEDYKVSINSPLTISEIVNEKID